MFVGIDFYSDTVTRPSAEMKKAMMNAPLGDEQQGEDPSTKALEQRMAKDLNKAFAMFFPSATMCNQVAATLHCSPGDEVIAASNSHIINAEGGGLAVHAHAQVRAIPALDGTFGVLELNQAMRHLITPHSPKSALLVVENTMNSGGGTVWPLKKLHELMHEAKRLKLKTHLDGSRLYNAAVASGQTVANLSQGFDSVTICFSKGLGAACGAILAFDQDYEKVRRKKQVFGGAMRQSGILAAACLYALDHHVDSLAEDHQVARFLGERLSELKGLKVLNPHPESNMIYFSVDENRIDPLGFLQECLAKHLRFSRMMPNLFRAVTHRDVNLGDAEKAVDIVSGILK